MVASAARAVVAAGHMLSSLIVLALITLCWHAAPARAWGVIGHEIVATIAQTQLHPDVRAHLCTILPQERTAYKSFYPSNGSPHQHCHLASFAAWADRLHGVYPWASHLHYVNPIKDDPPSHCTYGEYGWQDHGTGNVLQALVNYTSQLTTSKGYERDVALRFLTHFMADTHQPLHLTGRARGGNDVVVHYNGRYARLHTVWDSLMLNDQLRDLANYTTPLPSARIESALLGRTYDAYIRWILTEGLGQAQGANKEPSWWSEDDVASWSECPDQGVSEQSAGSTDLHRLRWLRAVTPNSSRMAQRIYSTIFRKLPEKTVEIQDPSKVDDTDLPICPYAWTKPMHGLVCSYAFASPVPRSNETHDPDHRAPLVELNVPEYAGRVSDDKIIHLQLARAGVRLAAVLNTILLPEAQKLKSAASIDSARYSNVMQVTRPQPLREAEQPPKKKHPKHGGHHNGGKGGQSPIISLIKVTASSIAEVIILSSVGYILARQGILDKRTQTKFNKVNVSIFTPALLFSKVAFSLDPGRLAELIIVPAGFVIITVVSGLSALLLSWMARLPRSQRNFTVACAITPNSNSLPVALMQSLVVTVPQLHWEEDGEAEDTANGMLGRALTYLVLFSTLGMFLRWSLASQLLSTMDEGEEEVEEEPVTGVPTQPGPATGRLIDHDDQPQNVESPPVIATSDDNDPMTPKISIRRSTQDGGNTVPVPRGAHRRNTAGWARSFPNSPGGSEGSDDDDDDEAAETESLTWEQQSRSCWVSTRKLSHRFIAKPLQAVTRFMTMPLYAALLSLIVAMISPLQAAIGSIEPLVGALETAGACSIPLTMVVLGAYFYDESDPKSAARPAPSDLAAGSATWQQRNASSEDGEGTLVDHAQQAKDAKRKPMPFGNGSASNGEGTAATASAEPAPSGSASSWIPSCLRRGDASRPLSATERREARKQAMERRTVIVSVGSRMIMTPILLLPLLAWYAIATRYNVVDDPVFITSACLLIGSPPALTLAQITSQSAKGSNSSFERLISKTIFVSYAIMATPTTIILVLTALLIAENDH